MHLKNLGLSILTAAMLLAYSGQASSEEQQAQNAYPRQVHLHPPKINLDWWPASKSVVVTVSTGCLTSSARNLYNTFSLSVDAEANTLIVDGHFVYTLQSKLVKRDCSKATSQRLSLQDVEPGSYRVLVNGKAHEPVDLGIDAIFQRPLQKGKR